MPRVLAPGLIIRWSHITSLVVPIELSYLQWLADADLAGLLRDTIQFNWQTQVRARRSLSTVSRQTCPTETHPNESHIDVEVVIILVLEVIVSRTRSEMFVVRIGPHEFSFSLVALPITQSADQSCLKTTTFIANWETTLARDVIALVLIYRARWT